MTPLREELLDILVCPLPQCRQRLDQRDDQLVCTGCGRRYRIEENWPVLIPEEAQPPLDGKD